MESVPPPPADGEMRNIIDKLANFVARNGPEFESVTKAKQKSNPKFQFLFGGQYYHYYMYRVNAEQAILNQQRQLQQQQQQQQQPPPWGQQAGVTLGARQNKPAFPWAGASAPASFPPPQPGAHGSGDTQRPPQQPPEMDNFSHQQQPNFGGTTTSYYHPPKIQSLMEISTGLPPGERKTPSRFSDQPKDKPSPGEQLIRRAKAKEAAVADCRAKAAEVRAEVLKLKEEKAKVLGQIEESAANLAAQEAVTRQQSKAAAEEAVRKARWERLEMLAAETGLDLEDIEAVIQPIIDSCTKDSISSGKGWIFSKATSHDTNKLISHYLAHRVTDVSAPFSLKLHLIYLVNDVLHHCVRKGAEELKKSLESVAVEMFCSGWTSCGPKGPQDDEDGQTQQTEARQAKLSKLIKLWEDKNIFSQSTMNKMRAPEESWSLFLDSLAENHARAVQVATADFIKTYENYAGQHKAFATHAESKVAALDARLVEAEARLAEAEENLVQAERAPLDDEKEPSQVEKALNEKFERAAEERTNAIEDGGGSHAQQQQQQPAPPFHGHPMPEEVQGHLQPPPPHHHHLGHPHSAGFVPGMLVPDLSRPPPGFMAPPVAPSPQMPPHLQMPPPPHLPPPPMMGGPGFMMPMDPIQQQRQQELLLPPALHPPHLQQQHHHPYHHDGGGGFLDYPAGGGHEEVTFDESSLIPSLHYYDLPAGLMVPLVEKMDYRPINPKNIRLPPPLPPSDKLLNAVEEFYAAPTHDRPRDAEGFEKLGLYEWYKEMTNGLKKKADEIEAGRAGRSPTESPDPYSTDDSDDDDREQQVGEQKQNGGQEDKESSDPREMLPLGSPHPEKDVAVVANKKRYRSLSRSPPPPTHRKGRRESRSPRSRSRTRSRSRGSTPEIDPSSKQPDVESDDDNSSGGGGGGRGGRRGDKGGTSTRRRTRSGSPSPSPPPQPPPPAGGYAMPSHLTRRSRSRSGSPADDNDDDDEYGSTHNKAQYTTGAGRRTRGAAAVSSRSRSRSLSPERSFAGFGSQSNPLTAATKLDSSNKGHQMLQKMGWSGVGGLGSNESGIEEPISGGEIRDKGDMYRGVGSRADPFEMFRKSKAGSFYTRMKEREKETKKQKKGSSEKN